MTGHCEFKRTIFVRLPKNASLEIPRHRNTEHKGGRLSELIKKDDTHIIVRDVYRAAQIRRKFTVSGTGVAPCIEPALRVQTHVRYTCTERRTCARARCIGGVRGCRWRITRSGKANEEGLKPRGTGRERERRDRNSLKKEITDGASARERKKDRNERCVASKRDEDSGRLKGFAIETKAESAF